MLCRTSTQLKKLKRCVRAARYYPEGRRGCDSGARSSAYNLIESETDYFARSNREMLVAVWVEGVEGIKNLDAILQVPGIDAVNIASGDLALSMGLPGRSGHPGRAGGCG